MPSDTLSARRVMRFVVRAVAGVVPLALFAASGYAQTTSRAGVPEPSPDTGRMRPAYTVWTAYTTPGMCLDAGRQLQHMTDRLGIMTLMGNDTLAYDVARDTMSTIAVRAVQSCSRAMTPANTEPRHFRWLLWTALVAGDDARARSLVAQSVERATTPRAQGDVYQDAIEIYLSAHRPREALARDALGRLDALGAPARVPQMYAHLGTMYYARVVRDQALMHAEAARAIAVSESLTAEDLQEGILAESMTGPYDALLEDTLQVDPRAAAVASILERRQTLSRKLESWSILPAGSTAGFQQFVSQFSSVVLDKIGAKVPIITGKYVYGADAATTFPRKGHFTLLRQVSPAWRSDATGLAAEGAEFRRLRQKYGDRLEIVLFTKTIGYTPGSMGQRPADEAESIRQIFLDEQKFPVTLVVDEAAISVRPDGRRDVQDAPYQQYFSSAFYDTILAGPDGRCLYLVNFNTGGVIDRSLDAAMARVRALNGGAAAP